jgi:hypothetical protein
MTPPPATPQGVFGQHRFKSINASLHSDDHASALHVVRCDVHDAPALVVTDPTMPGGGLMICMDDDEATLVADALHQSVAGAS